MQEKGSYSIVSVQRALQVLDLFDGTKSNLTLAELSQSTGITKSSVMRILHTLRESEYLTYHEPTRTYSLGIKLYRLGKKKYSSLDVRIIAKKHLSIMSTETGMIGYISVREGDKIAVIEQSFPNVVPLWAQLMINPGGYQDMYLTGIGRLFLAQESDDEVKAYLNRTNLVKITENTVVNKEELFKIVTESRNRGYAINEAEHEAFIYSVCAPILDFSGKICAGISLCGVSEMFEGEKYDYCVKTVCKTAIDISNELGYRA